MANDEHLVILKKGVKEWNRWRENQDPLPEYLALCQVQLQSADLDGADLAGANLRRADLSNADLVAADLASANLERANLSDADLNLAYLGNADLRAAILRGADLRNAYLPDADLRGANLAGASLERGYLDGALFGGAFFSSTTMANLDLSGVKGLEDAIHSGPSTVGTDTLKKSKGRIPEAFLCGCGFEDWEVKNARLWDPNLSRDEMTDITYEVVNLKALSPIVLHHVFISYSHADTRFVEKLDAGLDEKRIRYWRDVHDMKAGRIERQVEKAIRINPLVLLVLSENSVESDWVEWEVSKARELEKKEKRDVLCPIALDAAWKTCDWPGPLRRQVMGYNILDFSDPRAFDEQFEKLVGGIVENYPSD